MSHTIAWRSEKTQREIRIELGAPPKKGFVQFWTSPNSNYGWKFGFFQIWKLYIQWSLRNRNV